MELARFYVERERAKGVSMNPKASPARTDPVLDFHVFSGFMLWEVVSTNGTQHHQDELSYSDFMVRWMLTT